MPAEDIRTEELTAVVREIRERVRSRFPAGALPGNVSVPDLMPIVHARDAAEAKVAAIGTVNPRPPGLVNSIAQRVKKAVSRALDWHVREQVEFNRAAMSCVQAMLETFEEVNRAFSQMAGYVQSQASELRGEIHDLHTEARELRAEARELKDVRDHWAQWRAGWEEKSNRNEVYMLRTISELNATFQHRAPVVESGLRQSIQDLPAESN